jgi:hypothetical protein
MNSLFSFLCLKFVGRTIQRRKEWYCYFATEWVSKAGLTAFKAGKDVKQRDE